MAAGTASGQGSCEGFLSPPQAVFCPGEKPGWRSRGSGIFRAAALWGVLGEVLGVWGALGSRKAGGVWREVQGSGDKQGGEIWLCPRGIKAVRCFIALSCA